ncbi:unnamed protein product [Brassica napus]|uniref:(rape) hypothetical protein n=1 Tax=Brassica napus TaxID=3708 RepID=A0A816TMK4_BRANA|nr:unnamed protein product [Brassica napus]
MHHHQPTDYTSSPAKDQSTDHNFRSCMERPKVFSPFKEVKPMTLAASPFKKVKPITPTEAPKQAGVAGAREVFFGGIFVGRGGKKTFDEFIDNLQNENALENEQDKPKKDTAGIVYKLMKNMSYKDGKGLGKKEDDIVEHLLVTQLTKHIWLDGAILFIKDNPQSKLKGNNIDHVD